MGCILKPRSARAAAGIVPLALVLSAALGCNDEELVRAPPSYAVVDGTPMVDEGRSAVDYRPPEANPDDFAYGASIRVDVFLQDVVRKVDILWMVDNSPSMTATQANLAANFAAFIQDLAYADPPVDYQIAVVTPDTWSEGGALRPIAGHPQLRYIACNSPELPGACNVGSLQAAETAFRDTVTVGADALPVERGLLAVHMALSEPMRSGTNAGFLRDDAALYVILVSDEGDASCVPVLESPPSGDHRECTFYPDCRCADDSDLLFGETEYFVRFLNGLKGYGNEDLVKVAAIVGDDREDVTLCVRAGSGGCAEWASYRGCRNEVEETHALYAPRYTETALRTGGLAISICEDDYTAALSEIGFAVSGQRRDFPLARPPVDPEILPFRVAVIVTEEDGRRSRTPVPHRDTTGDGGGWSYVRCEGQVMVNALRFHGDWIPPPGALVEVAYHVDAGGAPTCD
jgi:hypothetical protein